MSNQSQINEQTLRNAVLMEGVKQEQVDFILRMLATLDGRVKSMLSGDEVATMPRSELKELLERVQLEFNTIMNGLIESLEPNLFEIAKTQAAFEAQSLATTGAAIKK